MLSHNELTKGTLFILNGQPCQVLEHSHSFKGRGGSVMQVKIKNLATGATLSKTFHPGDSFEEAEVLKKQLKFLYSHREKYVFVKPEKASKRIELGKEQIGSGVQFLKQNEMVEGLEFEGEIINISLPIKVNLKVTEAPPGVRAGRAEAGTKQVSLETGAQINTPLFVEGGDIIEVNTQTGEYVRRIE